MRAIGSRTAIAAGEELFPLFERSEQDLPGLFDIREDLLHTSLYNFLMTAKSRAKNRGSFRHSGGSEPRKQRTAKKARMKAPQSKVLPLRAVKKMVKDAKRAGKKIVTTNGCFDILHVGHARYLAHARSLGDMLVVGVNADTSPYWISANKGPGRPIVPDVERAELIAALGSVDAVLIFNEETPVEWLAEIEPHIHVKGADTLLENMPERAVVEKAGGKIVRAKYHQGKSTTNVIKKIRESR